MYLFRDEGNALLKSLHSEMMGALSSRFEFFKSLLDEDDWSFVIKLHALIETVTTQAIVAAMDDDRIRAVVERLPLSDDQVGKLRIAKDLGIYTSGQRAFVRRLSTVRNQIVHNVDNLGFTFSEYLASLDKGGRKSWQDAICWFDEGKENSERWLDASLENPKAAVWLSGFMLSSLTLIDEKQRIGSRAIRAKAVETSRQILAGLLSPEKEEEP